jgi:hypothetical protein
MYFLEYVKDYQFHESCSMELIMNFKKFYV